MKIRVLLVLGIIGTISSGIALFGEPTKWSQAAAFAWALAYTLFQLNTPKRKGEL